MVTRGFRVTGLVQGVGFRWFVRNEARSRGLAGSVRNLPDGSVQVIVRGPEPALASLEEALRKGPAGSRVDRVAELPPAQSPTLPDPFRIE